MYIVAIVSLNGTSWEKIKVSCSVPLLQLAGRVLNGPRHHSPGSGGQAMGLWSLGGRALIARLKYSWIAPVIWVTKMRSSSHSGIALVDSRWRVRCWTRSWARGINRSVVVAAKNKNSMGSIVVLPEECAYLAALAHSRARSSVSAVKASDSLDGA